MGGIPINPVLRGLLNAYSMAERIKRSQRQDAAQRGWEADRARRAANEDTDIELKMRDLGATPVMGGLIEEPSDSGPAITRKPRGAQLFKRKTSTGEERAWEIPTTEQQQEKALAFETTKKRKLGEVEKELKIEETEELQGLGETPSARAKLQAQTAAAAADKQRTFQEGQAKLRRDFEVKQAEDRRKFEAKESKLQRESSPKPSQAQTRQAEKDQRSNDIDAIYSEALNAVGGDRKLVIPLLNKWAKERGGFYQLYRGTIQDRIERGEKAPQGYDPFRSLQQQAEPEGRSENPYR